jgi:hypothetical protein
LYVFRVSKSTGKNDPHAPYAFLQNAYGDYAGVITWVDLGIPVIEDHGVKGKVILYLIFKYIIFNF